MATQQEVIKKFMASLDKTTLSGTAALDEAIKACSNFNSIQEVINKMVSDCRTVNNAENFLVGYCGIILNNDDTGAITGWDAGGSAVKNAENIVPETGELIKFTGNSFTVNGLTIQLEEDTKFSDLTENQKFIWQGLYTWWTKGALDLIAESYGSNFGFDSNSSARNQTIELVFYNAVDGRQASANDTILNINEYYFGTIYATSNITNVIDRTLAHELTHSVMFANVENFSSIPNFIVEGMAELTHGIDDERTSNIKTLAGNSSLLKDSLDLSSIVDGNVHTWAYAGGYMFLRYLAKQAADEDKFITNISSSVTLNGTASDDRIINTGEDVKISGGAGNDEVTNSGHNVTIEGGAGNDKISDVSSNSKISGGKGNDSIIAHYNTSYTDYIRGIRIKINGDEDDDYISLKQGVQNSINGGGGNDIIFFYGGDENIINGDSGDDTINIEVDYSTIIGGSGNDLISLSGGYNENLIQYSSGDGNDTIIGVSSNDTIKITDAKYSTVKSGNDLKINVGNGFLLLKGAANIPFKIKGIDEISGQNISNSNSNTIINGTSNKDTILNRGDNVTINASAGNDSIFNNWSDNVIIDSGAGNDIISIRGSNNIIISSGEGNDTVDSNSFFSTIIGGVGNDSIYHDFSNVLIDGGADNDTVKIDGYVNTIIGGSGNDLISLSSASEENFIQYSLGDGNDTIFGIGKYDTLQISGASYTTTKSGSDLIIGVGSSKITVVGGANVDFKIDGTLAGGGSSTDTLPAGISIKNSIVTAAKTFTGNKIDLADYAATKVNASALSKAVSIVGTADNNSLKGGKGNDTIFGGSGNDTVSLGGGADVYIYHAGNDLIQDYKVEDKIKLTSGSITSASLSSSNVILKTSNGNITVKNCKDKKITVIDSNGNETSNIYPLETLPAGITIKNSIVTASSSFKGNKIDLEDYAATKVNASALSQAVSIIGTAAANSLKGGKGADTIIGGTGNDTVSLGGGKDIYIYSSGNDFVQDYKAGEDKISLASGSITSASLSSSNVILKTSNGNITIKNGKGKKITVIDSSGNETSNIYPIETLSSGISIKSSVLTASNSFKGNKIDLADYAATKVNAAALSQAVSIIGTAAANSLKGGKGADKIFAGAGNDTLWGGAGNDSLLGENGNDLLKGEAGNDTLSGGAGNDTLTGGAGNDTFIYSAGNDVITDYAAGDKIKISSGKISKTSYSGKNVIFTIGSGSLTVQNGKGKNISVTDSSGTKTYSRTLDILYDNNFMTDDTNLDSITENKFAVTQIQTQDYSSLAQNEKTFIAYAEK